MKYLVVNFIFIFIFFIFIKNVKNDKPSMPRCSTRELNNTDDFNNNGKQNVN